MRFWEWGQSALLDVGLHHPEPPVDTARDLGEDAGRDGVSVFVRLTDGFPDTPAEQGEAFGQRGDPVADRPDSHWLFEEGRLRRHGPGRLFERPPRYAARSAMVSRLCSTSSLMSSKSLSIPLKYGPFT